MIPRGLCAFLWPVLVAVCAISGLEVQAATPYSIGNPVLSELWVDPVAGSDTNSGTSRASPLKSLMATWAKIPEGATLSTSGYQINLLPGTFACEPGPESDNCQNYFANRRGTPAFPIIVRAADGPGTVTLRGGLNLNNLSYVYLLDLTMTGGAPLPTNSSGNNLLHIEGSDHLLIRGVTLAGPNCANDACNNLQEVLKVNQTQHLYVENSTIGGAWHSSVDYFVVQHGHFINNRVHTAGQWGMYVKGGSAYLLIEGNEFAHTQLGFQAGQSANFAMMRSPWLHYEAYDIKFVNNLLHDIPGVGVSVAGAYNVLVAFNTLYNVGTSTEPGYPMMSFVHGERNCTPTDELPAPTPVCLANADAGGWGPVELNSGEAVIPSKHIEVANNLLYNPAGRQTLYSHFFFEGDAVASPTFRNLPSGSPADNGLRLHGNVVWNGSAAMPTGAGDWGGRDTNPTCNEAQLHAENAINSFEPALVAPAQGNFHPQPGGNLAQHPAVPVADFSWDDAPTRPAVPQGTLSNLIATDRDGVARIALGPVGAYTMIGANVPGIPTLTRLVSGNGSIRVYFSPPSSDGGSTIAGYTARCTGDGATRSALGLTSPIVVTGLRNRTRYSCTIQATNAVGSSGESGASMLLIQPFSLVPTLMLLD